ncbi:asparagine synthase (glutamine-hydrolyzing) [Carboxylicivirga sp. M1479]|uniref:asparagine synthase (glutamine-hydrolyzing) n=1 Tax=Carboxylicivirga sp. M1479 TaxID=2594476 RepID=UPI0011787B24|nr:asparagine synthase (glutamine-hydrolyzing) [Carboxylicivirga sp. M1479]TRX70559.1 asparagine synthase (glutamine-hydrolyzing) [Carboxylicivirga sp. M1479]
MCGINGIFSHNKQTYIPQVELMNKAMEHRGPDDHGIHSADHITLGHQRLSIIDLSDAGHQPMHSADAQLTIVFNGEIYNFAEIRKELNYPFQSHSDTEVILAAWQQWGIKCLDRFNGMFAFAVWDHTKNELTVVRDRLGIKPLYYHYDGQQLVFSSEIRSLLASELIDRQIDTEGLNDYLRYQTVQAPNTILKDVWMLEPGSYMIISQGNTELKKDRWWHIDHCQTEVPDSYEDLKEEVRHRFYQSVQRRLVADVPFGAFLSGGIDSSAVVGAMAHSSNRQVKTFNISFAEKEFSEAKYAAHIAQIHQTDHTEINLSPNDFLNELPNALNAIDHPSGDGPNTWMVSKVTREAGVTMALSGLGGDELFAGYAIFNRMAKLDKNQSLWKLPKSLRQLMGAGLQKVKPGVASDKVKAILSQTNYDFTSQYAISRQVLLDNRVGELLSSDISGHHLPVTLLNQFNLGDKSLLTKVSISEISTYMQNVLLRDSDQMSMAHALEVRVPFLDHELVELLLSVPDAMKYPHTPKKLLVDSLSDLLPDYIVNRPKMGFVFPWSEWLKKDLFELADHHIKQLALRPYFNAAAVTNLWAKFNSGDPSLTYSRIWPLVVLNHWMETNRIS